MVTTVSTILIIGRHPELYQKRLQQIISTASTASLCRDPFVIVAAIIAELSTLLEEDRRFRDREVQAEEGKTGFAPMRVTPSLKLDNFARGSTRSLHLVATELQFLQRAVDFQIGLIDFLISQHDKLTTIRKSKFANSLDDQAAIEVATERTRRSLDLTLSSTRTRLKQIMDLTYRITAQIKIVDNIIAQGDSRVNIAIAEQSRKIAIDTKEDSVAMKTISALTMVFLPGTFVGVSLLELRDIY